MKITFKQYFYLIFLIGFVTFSFATCSKHVTSPFLDKQPDFQQELVFQDNQESRIKTNVESLLQKLIGKKTYVVSVVTLLNDKTVSEFVKEQEPKTLTRNESIEELDSESQEALSYLSLRPKTQDIREEISERGLPGLNLELLSGSAFGLPGFPALPDHATAGAASADFAYEQSGDESLSPIKSKKVVGNYTRNKKDFFFNEKNTFTTRPQITVKSVIVSVVIDKDYFDYLELSEDNVEQLIFNTAGLDAERGDQLSVSYVPFIQKGFSVAHFFKKNKVIIEKMKAWLVKLKPLFLLLAGIAAIFAFSLLIAKVLKWISGKQRQIKADALKKKQEKEEEERINKITEIEEMKQAIMQLAQSKPDQFSALMDSWIETDGDEL